MIDSLIINKEKNGLYISTKIRDEEENILVEINNNEWIINNNLILDKNFDEYGLEVINQKGEVILQINVDNQNGEVNFASIYYLRGDKKVLISPLDYSEDKGMHFIFTPLNESFGYPIEKIFKYPSQLHKGERI